MWEHAPLAPLFPYTTLFRSLAGSDDAGGFAVVHRGDPPHSPAAPEGDEQPRLGVGEEGVATADLLAGVAAERDRKSTRLNSSHVAISYAVFCLTKKKQQ